MDSRDRVLLAMNHQELDRVPFDLGGTGLTTIHVSAYEILRGHLMVPGQAPRIGLMAEPRVLVDEQVSERLTTDVWPVLPDFPSEFEYVLQELKEEFGPDLVF